MSRPVALILSVVACVACSPPPPDRKPLAQEPIGTGIPAPRSTSDSATSTSTSSTDSSSSSSKSSPPDPPDSDPGSPQPAKLADLCAPKSRPVGLSKMAASSGCKGRRPSRGSLLKDIQGNEQLLASTTAGSPDRENAMFRLAATYATLECALNASCSNPKEREGGALPEDISQAEARKKTDQYCASLKSEFPKGRKQCN